MSRYFLDEELVEWVHKNMSPGYSLNNKLRELAGLPYKRDKRAYKYPFGRMMVDKDYVFNFEKEGWDKDHVLMAMKQWNRRNEPKRIIFKKLIKNSTYVLTRIK